ncbi:MAG TPA: DUF5655 domain-containing protein [Acidimicrobiia bacterium]|nr:DUF5655 domain-containing protein [Acidimicrobiia bacterium]
MSTTGSGPFSAAISRSAPRRARSPSGVSEGSLICGRRAQYLRDPDAQVVLSIALERHDVSARFKEVAHPSPKHWIHHLEIHQVSDIDDEVATWLAEAAERAN